LRARPTILLSVALLSVLSGSCSEPQRPTAAVENAIPLNLDLSVPGLVDEQTPWGWSFQSLSGSGVAAEARAGSAELHLHREAEGADGRAVYDLNSPFAGQRLTLTATTRRGNASSASVRVGILVLDHDLELTETYSAWSDDGDLAVDAEVPDNSWNTQLVVDYRGSGDAFVGRLRLAVDGVDTGPALPGQTPPDPALVDWIRENGVALSTTDPLAPLDDLDALAGLIGDTPLVLLGESTHGSSEFFELKARVVKWLALRGDRLIFVIEDHSDKVEPIDRFIQSGEGDAASVVRGLFAFWQRQEIVDLVQWMRDATVAGDAQVTLAGVDLQVPLGPLARLESAAAELDAGVARTVEVSLAPMRQAWEEGWYPRRESAEYERWAAAALDIREALAAVGASERTLFDARLVMQSAEVSRADDMRLRDRYMAENLAWLREHSPAGSRFVVWAHNTHVRLDEDAMGQWLEDRYPGEVLSVGLFTDRGEYVGFDGSALRTYSLFPGPPESIERALHLAGHDLFALDLRPLCAPGAPAVLDTPLHHRNIGLWPMDLGFYRTVIPEGFHALLYVDQTTATRPIGE
jgi:erythromycin esterase